MERKRSALMEKLDRSFVEHLRQSAEAGSRYPADLIAVYEYLKSTTLKDSKVCTLLRYPDPLTAVLLCWRRNTGGGVFRLDLWLARLEGKGSRDIGRACPRSTIRVWFSLFGRTSARKRRGTLKSSQQVLYGDDSVRGEP